MKSGPKLNWYALALTVFSATVVGLLLWNHSNSEVSTEKTPPEELAPDAGQRPDHSITLTDPAAANREPVVAISSPLTLPSESDPFIAFAKWTALYVTTALPDRPALVAEGITLANARRPEMDQLIRTDPRRALENAVPMVTRQQLPPDIVNLIEERISGVADIELLAVSADSDPSEPRFRRFATIGDREIRSFVYGRRDEATSVYGTTVNGIAINRVMAIHENPVRPLEVGEIPDASKEASVQCPDTGKVTPLTYLLGEAPEPITIDSPAIEVGDKIIYGCECDHLVGLMNEILAADSDTFAADGGVGGPTSPTEVLPLTRRQSTGIRRILDMRLVFPDRLDERQGSERDAWDEIQEVDDYFQESSYGKLSFQGTVTPIIVLPRTETWYQAEYDASNGSVSAIMNDAKDAAREMGYSPENYHHYVVRYRGSVGTFGGLGSINGPNTWLKNIGVGTYIHEIGHNIGIRHASYWDTSGRSIIGPGNVVAYGNRKDVMGSSASGGHFNASHKNVAQWLTPESYQAVRGSGLYRIYQFDQPIQDPDFRYALKIAKDFERDYFVEYRLDLSSLPPWYEHGAVFNWGPWSANSDSQLLDMTPGSRDNNDRHDVPLTIGRTFSDYEADIHVTPVGKGGTTPESLDMQVHIGTAASNTAPTITSLTASAGPYSTGSPVTFTVSATDTDGDPLSYAWNFGEQFSTTYRGHQFSVDNLPTQAHTFSTNGWYAVQCTVSDMKGGSTTETLLIQVGTPTTYYIAGKVTDGTNPIVGVRVDNGFATSSASLRWSYTDSDGDYYITNLSSGSYSIQAEGAAHNFTSSSFSNPVSVSPNRTGFDFVGSTLSTVMLSAIDNIGAEGGGTAAFRITRTGSTFSSELIHLNFGGSASTSDYTLNPAAVQGTSAQGLSSNIETFTIPAGSSQLDVVLTPTQDTATEGPETLVITHAYTGVSYLPSGPQFVTLTIDDDEGNFPRVTLEISDDEATEGSPPDPATFEVHRAGSSASPLTVFFTRDLTPRPDAVARFAASSGDYNSIGSSVTIPAGASSAPITITPINDSIAEGTELVEISLSTNSATYVLGTPNSQTIKILDDDTPNVSVTANDASISELGDTGTFTISRTGVTTESLKVHYSTGGAALHGTDYLALSGFVTLAPGESSATVEIIPINDDLGEPSQSVSLMLRSGAEYRIAGTGRATMNITDHGDLPVVTVSAMDTNGTNASEPNQDSRFRIFSSGTGAGFTVNYQVSGTATSGSDFTALPGSATLSSANGTFDITLDVRDDSLYEDAETVILTILPGSGYVVDSRDSATISIRDDESRSMVTVIPDDSHFTEGTTGRFLFGRSNVFTTNPVTIYYTVSGTAGASDYAALSGNITIPAGDRYAYVNVNSVNDSIAEGLESVIFTITPDTGPTPAYGIEIPSATINILDNDNGALNVLSFAEVSKTVSEGDSTATISVNRSGPGLASTSCSVEYAVRYTTATGSGIDFELPVDRLEFAPGESTADISIPLIEDSFHEAVEAVTVLIRNPGNAEIANNGDRSTLFILDNEPSVSIVAIDPFGYEGTPVNSISFRISRMGSTANALNVPLISSGTAVSGLDYNAVSSFVTIPAGASFYDLVVFPRGNPAANAPRELTFTLRSDTYSLPGKQSSATAFLGDAQTNDPPFVKLVSPRGTSPGVPSNVTLRLEALASDDTPANLITTWSKLSGPGTVTFDDSGELSTGATFSASGSYTLRLTASDGSQSTTLDVPIAVGAAIVPWSNVDIGATTYPGSSEEQGGRLTISASGTRTAGTTDKVFFRHRRLNGDGEIIARVRNILYSNNYAVAGVMIRDSTANTSRMVSMQLASAASANSNTNQSEYLRRTSSTSVFRTTQDGALPSSWVRLTRVGNTFRGYTSHDGVEWEQRGTDTTTTIGANAYIGLSVTSGTDSELTLAEFDNVQIIGTPENNGPLVAAGPDDAGDVVDTFSLSGTMTDDSLPSDPGNVTTEWSLVSGPTAPSFADASSPATTVTFIAGGTYVLRLTADDGEVITSDETTLVVDAPPTSLPLITVASASSPATEEGLVGSNFTVTRDQTSGTLAIHYTIGGSATAGSDYTAMNSSFVFPNGWSTFNLAVTPLADTLSEGDETVTLTLSSNATYDVGSPAAATVTITDLPGDDWRFEAFGANANNPAISGFGVDADGDMLTNLEEYALDTNPTVYNPSPMTVDTTTVGSDEYLRLTIPRNSEATDVTFEVQACSDLIGWDSNGLVIEVDSPTMLRVRDSSPMSTSTRRFMHLKLTR